MKNLRTGLGAEVLEFELEPVKSLRRQSLLPELLPFLAIQFLGGRGGIAVLHGRLACASFLEALLQKVPPPVPLLPSRLGQVKPAEKQEST